MDEEGPFKGIIGYSEGTTIAATRLLTEQQRFEQKGRLSMFKRAAFSAGWPPMTPDAEQVVLSDTSDLLVPRR